MELIKKCISIIKNPKVTFGLILAFSFLFIVGISKNSLENDLTKYHPDEYHTIYLAVQSMETGKITNFRALEGSRWLYRFFYPGALISMSQKMGGHTTFTGWNRAGHKYIQENYIGKTSNPNIIREKLKKDPNLRDFFFALRLQSVLFMFICLIPLLYYSYKRKYYWAIISLVVFLGLNSQLASERSYAYIEPLLLGFISILLSLFLYLYKKKKISFFIICSVGFISAFALSVKFSSLFFILLLFSSLFINKKKNTFEDNLKKSVVLIVSFGVSFIMINYYGFFGDFNAMLHDFVSNFWKYSSGGFPLSGSEETTGVFNNIKRLTSDLVDLFGYAIYLVPIIILFGFKYASKKQRIRYGIILLLTLITFFSLSKQVEFLDRNIVPFYVPLLFVLGVLLSVILKKIKKKAYFKNTYIPLAIVTAVICVGYLPVLVKNYSKVFPSKTKNMETAISAIPEIKDRDICYINMSESDFDDLPNKKKDVTSDIYFVSGNYKDKIGNFKNKISKNDIVVINRAKRNYYQYSNFLLPRYYDTNKQFGNYFVFYNEKLEKSNSTYKKLLTKPLVYDNGLTIQQVSIAKTDKNICRVRIQFNEFTNDKLLKDKSLNFQGYAYPKNRDLLPTDRVKHGFENFGSQKIFDLKRDFGSLIVEFDFTPSLKEYKWFRFVILDKKRKKGEPYKFVTVKDIDI